MTEGFKIVICILGVMLVIGEFHLFQGHTIFPRWIYAILSFYIILLYIDERVIPLLKDIGDLFQNDT
jgi:hypothetical protein